ncbi:helix-turn-helix domain-containing protein [Shewanella mangrovisoli]|uniref:helix-turn-helix domain-containing protein n=1 Tax=Shewanella mangrovisoli TaxID=2864211 RepID=UPI0035B97B1B
MAGKQIVMKKAAGAIIAARKRAGYTQRELAEKIGVHVNSIANWESIDVSPDIYSFSELCTALNISPNYALGFDESSEVESLKKEISILKRRINDAKIAN